MAEVASAKTLDQAHVLAVKMAHRIERTFIVEAYGLHHHGVAFPSPYGIPKPGGLGIGRQFAPVGEDLAEGCVELRKHDELPRELDDFDRSWCEIQDWQRGWEA